MLGYIKRLNARAVDGVVRVGTQRTQCLEETLVRLQSKMLSCTHNIEKWRLLAIEFQTQA